MDYRRVFVLQLMCALLAGHPHSGSAIVGRDLLLTPKQSLQRSGKSIYYKEDHTVQTASRNQSVAPWERTLKHVTFVTLFASVAAGAARGNKSELQEYSTFLRTPYISQEQASDARFGDIVTLASGRLEATSDVANGSYRFVEGPCGQGCESRRVWALWQVQKIRHRDVNGKYRYEMKFSVSPLRAEDASGEGGKATAPAATTNTKRGTDEGAKYARHTAQTYIQKEDDYPQSFGRIVYPDEQSFADRRLDAGRANYNQATPMPQSTFTHGIFQPPPPPPPAAQHQLNIGEYLKDLRPPSGDGKPAFHHYTNMLGLGVGRNHFVPPTTYRPQHHYQLSFPRPELYKPPSDLGVRYTVAPNPAPEPHRHEGRFGTGPSPSTPLVAHHYHHHFFMPSNSADNGLGGAFAEDQTTMHDDGLLDQTPNYYGSRPSFASAHEEDGSNDDYVTPTTPRDHPSLPPAPHKVSFPQQPLSVVQQQHVVRVTPVPPLRRPTTYPASAYGGLMPPQLYPKVPLQVYAPPPVVEYTTTARQRPFVQSEPLRMGPIRYSDPDPLYIGVDDSHELNAPQLEAPKTQFYRGNGPGTADGGQRPNSIAAQLPPPDKDQDVRIPYIDDPPQVGDSNETTEEVERNQHKLDLQQHPSQKAVHVSTEKTTATTQRTETPPKNVTMPTTTNEMSRTAGDNDVSSSRSSTAATHNQRRPIATKSTPASSVALSATPSVDSHAVDSDFVSTSTSQTPLRSLSRYRATHTRTTSTTERPVLKWKPRRKFSANATAAVANIAAAVHDDTNDNKAKSSVRHEEAVPGVTTATNRNTSVAAASPRPPPPAQLLPQTLRNQRGNEIFEVLTQKSVSRSISIKVGQNGEEIPIVVNDADTVDGSVTENEVARL